MRTAGKDRIDCGWGKGQDLVVCKDAVPALIHLLDVEVAEVIKDHQIGKITGGNGTLVIHQEVARRLMTCHLDGNDGIGAAGNGFPNDVVDVTAPQKIKRVLIVCGKHAAGVILLIEQRQKRPQIACGGALTDHNKLTELQLFQRILVGAAFVVGVDAGGDVGIEISTGKLGSVPVDLFVVCLACQYLADDGRIAVDDANIVHHLRQPQHTGVLVQRVDGEIVQTAAALVHRGGRHTARQHKVNINGQVLGCLQHIADTVYPHDIGDLVWIGDDGGGTVPHHSAGKFGGGDHAAFQMDMGINEAGADKFVGDIDLLPAVVAADAGNQTIGNSNISMAEIIAENIKIGGVFEYNVGRLLSACDADQAELAVQLALHALGGGFIRLHGSPSFYS